MQNRIMSLLNSALQELMRIYMKVDKFKNSQYLNKVFQKRSFRFVTEQGEVLAAPQKFEFTF